MVPTRAAAARGRNRRIASRRLLKPSAKTSVSVPVAPIEYRIERIKEDEDDGLGISFSAKKVWPYFVDFSCIDHPNSNTAKSVGSSRCVFKGYLTSTLISHSLSLIFKFVVLKFFRVSFETSQCASFLRGNFSCK